MMNRESDSAHRRNSASDRQPIIEAWGGSQGLEWKIQPVSVEILCEQPAGKRNIMERRPLLTIVWRHIALPDAGGIRKKKKGVTGLLLANMIC